MDEGKCSELLSLIEDNVDFFESAQSDLGQRFSNQFGDLHDAVTQLRDDCALIARQAHLYDFDAETPGNGYRTCLIIVNRFLPICIKLCRHVVASRDSMFFRSEFYQKELEAHLSVVAGMQVSAQFLRRMLDVGTAGDLFVGEKLSIKELLEEYGSLPQVGFYGRLAGFYFCESMRRIITGLNIVMASFSDQYRQSGGALAHAAASLINCGKYTLNPEARANHIVDVTQNASLDFLKAFWSLNEGELLKRVPQWICPSLEVCEVVTVPTTMQRLPTENGLALVDIPVPSSHLPRAPVRCRLLSYRWRKGQEAVTGSRWFSSPSPPSKGLLLHCHGGGFVSQTPDSHECCRENANYAVQGKVFTATCKSYLEAINGNTVLLPNAAQELFGTTLEDVVPSIYLRDWAKDLDVPILTVDYSLSPEAPFPRALEEVLHVYAWALLNHEKLGWTGENICVAGDSAGGNLMLALCLKTIELKIRRPSGVFAAYTPVMLSMAPSPSRILCAVDPLLPLGFMLTCLHAYIGCASELNIKLCPKAPPETPARRKGVTENSAFSSSHSSAETNCISSMHPVPKSDLDTGNSERTSPPTKAKMPLTRTKNVVQLEVAGELPSQYLCRFASQCDEADASCQADQHEDEHVVLEMPVDLTFPVRNRCCRAATYWVRALVSVLSASHLYQRHVLANWELLCGQSGKKRKGLAVPWFRRASRFDRKFQTMKILASNPFISPYLAPGWMLQKMPPCYFVGLHLDPTLDDLVMLSKRLKAANRYVQLVILDNLPHAFLNFLPFCKEAHEGSKRCVEMIKQALRIQVP